MPEPVEEQLGFDISGALQGIGQIDDALTQVVSSFQVGLASALETLTSAGTDLTPIAESLDVAGLGPAIDTALGEANAVVPVEADTSAAVDEIEQLALGLTETILVDADTSSAEEEIGQLGLGLTVDVPIDADISAAVDEIASLEGETLVIPVEVDTGPAQDPIVELGGATRGVTGNVLDLSVATSGFAAASALGRGEVGGLASGVGLLGASAAAAAGGISAGAASIGLFFSQALDAEAALLRLNNTFGPLAVRIERLRVGDLNADLSELALSLGSDDDALRNIASTLFLFQEGAGTSRIEASKFSESVLALSARAVALNPALGAVEDVAGRLGNVLGRGGRFASAFGISLSSTEIKARAAENATQGLGDGVSFASLQLAGSQLAIERYGNSLDREITQGTKNPIIQLAALRQKFEEATEVIGQPLIAPIFEVLTAIEPAAEGVAEVLGKLGEIVIPLLSGIAPLLTPIVGLLDLVAEGLGAVATVVDAIPGPVIALAAGIGLLAVAVPPLVTALSAMAVAGSLSLGPAGWVILGIGALAALGAAVGLFGGHAEDAALNTEGLGSALFGTAENAAELASALGGTDAALAEYLATQLKTGDSARTNAEAINKLGLSYDTLAGIVSGSEPDFFAFVDSIRAHSEAVGLDDDATNDFIHTLFVQRDTLQATAAAQLDQLLATGQITEAQFDQVRAQNGINDALAGSSEAVGDNVTALREATRAAQANAQAQIVQGLSAGQLQRAFLDLRPAIAAGTVTAEDAQVVADQLGISVEDAESAVTSLSDAMDSFVSTGLSALPDAGAAISDFASGIESARSALDSALADGGDTSGVDAIARAQEDANRSIADNAEQTSRTLAEAQRRVEDAQRDLAAAEARGGAGQEAAIRGAQGKLTTALESLTRAREEAGQSQADAVRDGSRKVTDAQADANRAQDEQTAEARAAQDRLIASLDPQRVIDAQNRATFTILSFQANLTTLLQRGRDNAVAALIAQGPETGGQLASALVSDDAKAKAFDGGIALANRITSGYGQFLEEHKAELSGRLVTLADGQIVTLADSFSTGGETVGRAFTGGVARAIDASPAVKEATQRLIEGGAAAFDPNLAASPAKAAGELAGKDAQAGFATNFQPDAAATAAIGKVPAAITNGLGPINVAVTTAGDEISTRFNPNFAAQIFPAMLAVLTAIDQGVTDIQPFVEIEGGVLGDAFATGLADALGSADNATKVKGAAGGLAAQISQPIKVLLGIDSPSKVGVDIGNQFVAGIVQGLEQLSPLQRATAAVALALIPDLTPALKQVPALAPAIVASAAAPVAAAVGDRAAPAASAVPGKDVRVSVDLHKVDVDPKHLADEIAWTIG